MTEGAILDTFFGLPKKDDVWMPMQSPNLFLDGGIFLEAKGPDLLPLLCFVLIVRKRI
jgi:hypothetical protein